MQTLAVSPLKAAREDRGMSLASAARSSGLAIAAAEALETGDIRYFASIDEMVAAAVLYAASIGVDSDAATLLYTRAQRSATSEGETARRRGTIVDSTTIVSDEVRENFPDFQDEEIPPSPTETGYRRFVRSDESGADEGLTGIEIELAPPVKPQETAYSSYTTDIVDTPMSQTVHAARQLDPAYDEAIQASLDNAYDPGIDDDFAAAPVNTAVRTTAVGRFIRQSGASVLGRDRAQKFGFAVDRGIARTGSAIEDTRTRLQDHPNGVLILALLVGMIMIGLLVAVSSAISGDEATQQPAAAEQAQQAAAGAEAGSGAAAGGQQQEAAASTQAEKPLIPPNKFQIDVLNAGSTKGKAAELADALKNRGYKVREVGNSEVSYNNPVILFADGYKREAAQLGKRTAIKSLNTLPGLEDSPVKMIVIIK